MRALAVLIAALLATPARAGSLETAPTTIEMSPARTAVLHVVNRADYPVTFQVEAFDWTQGEGEDRLDPSAVLQASPPMAALGPGEKQVVRLRATGRPSASGEQSFRLLVSELPGPEQAPGQQVRVLLQFSVPVFAAAKPGEASISWRAERDGPDLILTATNTGPRRAKLSRLTLTAAGEPHAVPGGELIYVLSGASRRWRVPDVPRGAVSVQAGAGEIARSLNVSLSVEE